MTQTYAETRRQFLASPPPVTAIAGICIDPRTMRDYPKVCEVILTTFEENNVHLKERVIYDNDYRNDIVVLACKLLGVNGDFIVNSQEIRNQLRQNDLYEEFNNKWQRQGAQLPNPPIADAPNHYACFNWKTKLAFFAVPPIGIGLAYAGVGKKAMNEFFAEHTQAMAVVLASPYVILFLACALQYCKNNCNSRAINPDGAAAYNNS
jgi:hypothetical protein